MQGWTAIMSKGWQWLLGSTRSPRLSRGLIPDREVTLFPLYVFWFGSPSSKWTLGNWWDALCYWDGDFPLAGRPVTSVCEWCTEPSQLRIWDRISCFQRSPQNRGAIQWRKWDPKLTPVTPLFAEVNKERFVAEWMHIWSGLGPWQSIQSLPFVPLHLPFGILFLLLFSIPPSLTGDFRLPLQNPLSRTPHHQ